MPNHEIKWRQAGTCPSCGVLTEHTWFDPVLSRVPRRNTGDVVDVLMAGSEGRLKVSQCVSTACNALALWLEGTDPESGVVVDRLVYPQTGVRIPPAEGLRDEESRLYKEAAAIAPISPRAASALVRALLEAHLKRHLNNAGQPVKGKRLMDVIDMAVDHLDLSTTLKRGLTAIRDRGNKAMHDPYGLTDDARAEELPWLFRAVDTLVLELDITPKKWADMAGQ